MSDQRGVSLIEIILVIAIIALIGATTIPAGSAFLIRNHLRNKANELATSLRIAQINTLVGKEDSQWGVHISSSQIIMFKGATYSAPGTSFDQDYDIPASISITQTEVVFDKLTGNPNSTATITVSSNAGDSNTVTVNEVGAVNVN